MATLYNQATLSFAGGSIQSNITSAELLETLSITKTAVSGSYSPGDRIVYQISIVNSDASPVTGLSLSDDLGAYSYQAQTLYPLSYVADSVLLFVDGVQQPAPAVTAGPPLTISDLAVPAEGSISLLYEAEVTAYAPLGADAQITNTASLSGAAVAETLTASAAISADQEPRLSITKAVSPETVSADTPIEYSFVLQNLGGEAGADAQLVVSDSFDPALQNLSVATDSTPMPKTAYSYDESTGLFATGAGQLTVPAASFTQNADGSWSATPGVTTLYVSGTL